MPVSTVQVYSNTLQTRTWYSAILPYADVVGPPPYGVLLLLHGRYGDHTTWIHNTRIVLYAEYLPIMVILPQGGNSRWSGPTETWVMGELREHVRSVYRMREDVEWALGGMSMGGYGALRLALKHPERFSSVYAHSSAVGRDALPAGEDLDLRLLADRVRDPLPRLTFDCGEEDPAVETNRRLHAHLEGLGLAHAYRENPGGHTWDYWDLHVREGLRQHLEVFGVSGLEAAALPAHELVALHERGPGRESPRGGAA